MLVSIVWTAIAVLAPVGASWHGSSRLTATACAAAVLVLSTVLFSLDATDAEHPEQNLSEQLAPLVEPTYEAIVDGVGAATGEDGRYLIQWSDSHMFGSQVYGLINELDRRGLTVGGAPYFTVPLTPPLTMSPEEATAEVHFASGVYVERWRKVPEAVEVASSDLRTGEQRQRYRTLRRRAIATLERDGLDELVPTVDTNVFGVTTDDRTSLDTRAVTAEMLQLGTELAVFIIPKGTVLAD